MSKLLIFTIILLSSITCHAEIKYTYTSDWFSSRIPTWEKFLSRFSGKKNLRYLEVGVYEGRSAFWLLDNIWLHESNKMTLVDMFFDREEYVTNFNKNLSQHPRRRNVKVIKGDSNLVLKSLPINSFDLIYLDGSHLAKNVFVDLANSWLLLKVGGLLVIDNYMMITDTIKSSDWPMDASPKLPVDAFISSFINEVKVIHRSSVQVMLEKLNNPFPNDSFYSTLVPTKFMGLTVNLLKGTITEGGGAEVQLSPGELKYIISLLNQKKLGQDIIEINQSIRSNKIFKRICNKTKLDCKNTGKI